MPIVKPTKAANGVAVAYHTPVKLEVDFRTATAAIVVYSHADEAAAITGLPVAWAWNVPINTCALSGEDLQGSIEAALVAVGTPFEGGSIVAERSDTLSGARARAWAAVKAARAVAEAGTFTYDGGIYQADLARVTSSTTAAALSKSLGLPYSETWTLADNTTRLLDGDQVIALGLALNQHISRVYATGRELREQINQAETIEAANAIRWPA
ncbi:DUF4376 domain-containing protein [Pseudoduganella sp. HUAS MS19]